ncbi:hypothetical protein DV704_06410 [Meiothermus sp. QL-1]|uniref:hypothetical protein n=1 Tax=Meiothermus sp. QL-1 TaxID=2058095 RepID=UPI000E0B0174|nr:hypothetical protein [Meiothermus sp. QL-1]RDI95511.1 hypothetical protein DV704_06410 [Meiothermus sp. QL-1]
MTGTLGAMLAQSLEVLTRPSVAAFASKRGSFLEASLYVLAAAAVGGLFSLGSGGFLSGVAGNVLGFWVFAYLVHRVGGSQGSLDHLAYRFALFWAPLNLLFSLLGLLLALSLVGIPLLPLLALAALGANAYLAYLATQATLGPLGPGRAWLALGVAFAGTLAVGLLLAALLR